MKRTFNLFFGFLLCFSGTALAQPTVEFYADNTSGCTPMTINFFNTSTTGDHFNWYFGDGNYANDVVNASNTYLYAGVYTVYLDAYDLLYNYLGSYSIDVTIEGQPDGFWVSDFELCPNDPVHFETWVSSPYYTWHFGDGTTVTTNDPWVDYSYTSLGTFNVTLEFFSTCGSVMFATEQVNVDNTNPYFGGFPSVGAYETTLCPGGSTYVYVNGGPYVSYYWDFGNGDVGYDPGMDVTYSSVGTYNVTTTLTNGCGIDTTLSQIITVNSTSPAPVLTIDGPSAICPGEQFFFAAYGPPGLTLTWDFGDGSPLVTSTDNYVYYAYSTAGTYNVQLTVTNLCGNTSNSSFTINVNNSAPVNDPYFDVQPDHVCPGDAFNFWVPWQYDYYVDFGDGNGTTTGYNYAYDTPGVYPIYAILQNSCGSTVTLYDTIYVQTNLPINGSVYLDAYPSTACPGESINFYGSYGYSSYEWTFGDGYTSAYEEVSHPYLNPGNYNVSLTITNGCGADTTVYSIVSVMSNLPVSDLDWTVYADEVCPGTTVYMAADDNSNLDYSWNFGDGSTATGDLVSHVYNTPGTYTIGITGVNGCGNDSSATYQIDVVNGITPDLSLIDFEAQTPGCVGDNLYFVVVPAGLGTYAWDFGDGDSGFSDQLLFVEGQPFVAGFHSYDAPGTYMATLTITNQCGNTADTTISVQVGALGSSVPADVFFWNIEAQPNCQGQPVTFYAVGAATYVWDFGDGTGNLITYNSLSPVEHIYQEDGNYQVTLIGFNGCGNSDDNQEEVFIPDSDIHVNTNTVNEPDCGMDNGMAIVSATGGLPPYTYSWTNGDQGVIADSLGSGIYVVSVTDNNGCSTEAIAAVSDAQGPVILLENIVHNDCYGQSHGVISVSVLGGAPPYQIQWSNGDATEDIFNLEAGPYEIFVIDANGCFAVESFTVEQPAQSIVSVYTQSATCGGFDGEAVAAVSNGVAPFNYIWPNTSGSSDETAGLAPGVYELLVIDGNTCLLTANFVINEVGGPIIVTDSITDATCSGDLSAVYISTIGGVSPFTYDWSNGATSQDLTGVLPGSYSLEVEGSNGCSSFKFFDLEMSAPDQTDICIVTVDSTTNSNLVVWNKLPALDVVSYNIYKESSQSGLYYLVGNQSADSLSQYHDYLSNPAIRSWRYKVAAVDDCGNEAELSSPHKTIHLTSNLGVGGVVNLIWDHYNGFYYDTYYINRYHPSTGWMVIDSVGSTSISYTDLTPPSDSNLVYVIEIVPPSTCTATKVQDHNSSRSNKSSINAPDPGSNLGMEEEKNENLSIYPNPTTGLVQLLYSSMITEVRLYDMSGQLVYRSGNNATTASIDCTNLARGVYTIQLNTSNGIIYSRLVKQ